MACSEREKRIVALIVALRCFSQTITSLFMRSFRSNMIAKFIIIIIIRSIVLGYHFQMFFTPCSFNHYRLFKLLSIFVMQRPFIEDITYYDQNVLYVNAKTKTSP